jgi:hypothetical protein
VSPAPADMLASYRAIENLIAATPNSSPTGRSASTSPATAAVTCAAPITRTAPAGSMGDEQERVYGYSRFTQRRQLSCLR